MTIPKITHVVADDSPVLLEQGQTSVTTAVAQKRDQSNRVGLLAFEISLYVLEGDSVGPGDPDIRQTETPSSFNLVGELNSTPAQNLRTQVFASLLGAICVHCGYRRSHLTNRCNFGEEITLLLQ